MTLCSFISKSVAEYKTNQHTEILKKQFYLDKQKPTSHSIGVMFIQICMKTLHCLNLYAPFIRLIKI